MHRVRGVRCNSSRRSHAELDDSTELDSGDPDDFGRLHAGIRAEFPWINIMGGCCGTNESHMEEVCRKVLGEGGGAGGE